MITEKDTIKCESIFNDERTHRYLWKRVWDKDKPIISVIMLNPSQSDNIITDTTTGLVVNNVGCLNGGEYGGVEILNLYSKLTPKLRFSEPDDELNCEENDSYILQSVKTSSKVVLAWGKAANTNARIEERAIQVLNLIKDYKDKLYVLSDGERKFLHPLTPVLRSGNNWVLEKFTDNIQPKTETNVPV